MTLVPEDPAPTSAVSLSPPSRTPPPPSPSPPANLVRDLRRLLQHSFSHQRTNLVQRKRLGPQEHLLPVGRWNPPPPAPQPTWFETSGDCSNTASAINGPTLFRGKDLDPKSICFQLEDGTFELRQGFLNQCGGPCCIFVGEKA